jgi:hypothetical protein
MIITSELYHGRAVGVGEAGEALASPLLLDCVVATNFTHAWL